MRNEQVGRASTGLTAGERQSAIAMQGGNSRCQVVIFLTIPLPHAQQPVKSLLPHAVAQEFIAVTLQLVGNDFNLLLRQAHLYMSNGRKHDHRGDDRREQAVDLTVMKHF